MLFKQFVPIAVALTLGTSQVSAASHGEVEDYDGGKIRWQQVAKGVFTGVPADQWDDNGMFRAQVSRRRLNTTDKNSQCPGRRGVGFCQDA